MPPVPEVKVPLTLTAGQPVDDLVANAMQTIARKGRGFTLGLQRDEKEPGTTKIEIVESLPPLDEHEYPADLRQHSITDVDDFIAYVLRYGNKEKSLILTSPEKCTLIIDEMLQRGERERITMAWTNSRDWTIWSGHLNKPLKHKELLLLLRTQEHNLLMGDVLASVAQVKVNATVNAESGISDDGKSLGVTIRTTAGEELRKFPKSFKINLPVLDQDEAEEDEIWLKPEVRLQVELPDEPKELPRFVLQVPGWEQLRLRRIQEVILHMRKALPDWLVLHGSASYTARELGRDTRN